MRNDAERRAAWKIAAMSIPLLVTIFLFGRWVHKRNQIANSVNSVLALNGAARSFNPPALSVPDPRAISSQRNPELPKVEQLESFDTAKLWNEEEREYRFKFERHRAIKTYLNAPCRRYPEYQGTLLTLLEHGYGIAEWPEAIRAISSWSELQHHNTEQMRLLGIGEEDIPREIKQFRNENLGEWKRYRAILKARTGIVEEDLLDDLMNTPLHWPYHSDPLNAKGVVFNQGEKLFDDDAWMEESHREAMLRYSGEPRTVLTAREIAEKWGNEPLMVNEHESVIDRQDIHPALEQYRGEDYYEHKRRLDELGAQRVEDMKRMQRELKQGP